MNVHQDEPAPIAVASSAKIRFAIYAVSGALAGLFFAAPVSIVIQLLDRKQGLSWPAFFNVLSPLDATFWSFVMWRDGFMGGFVNGLIGGAVTNIFSSRIRHPIALASLWASLLATPALAAAPFLNNDPRSIEFVLPIAMCLILGGGYGLLLGVLARWFERWLEKRRSRRIEPMVSIEPP